MVNFPSRKPPWLVRGFPIATFDFRRVVAGLVVSGKHVPYWLVVSTDQNWLVDTLCCVIKHGLHGNSRTQMEGLSLSLSLYIEKTTIHKYKVRLC
jgi:hypothetical protein